MQPNITLRPEHPRDYPEIADMVLRSFKEGTNYSDGTGPVALIEEIRGGPYYIPELSFVAELDGCMVGHFLFSKFPLSPTAQGGHNGDTRAGIVMLAPVAVHADYLRRGIGQIMLRLGIERVKAKGYRGITVEGNYQFYNSVGFVTSSEYGIYPTSGRPLEDARYMMCQECYTGALKGIGGYIVYDMYQNA
jgi:predicted N-acetyltransferase YhbS